MQRKNTDRLTELFSHLEDVEIPEDLNSRIMARVQASAGKKERFAEAKQTLGVALCSVAILALALLAIWGSGSFATTSASLTTTHLMHGVEDAAHHHTQDESAIPSTFPDHSNEHAIEHVSQHSVNLNDAFETVANIFSDSWMSYLPFVAVVLLLLLIDHALRSYAFRKRHAEDGE